MKESLVEAIESIDFDQNQLLLISYSRVIDFHIKSKSALFTHSVSIPCYLDRKNINKMLGIVS